MIDGQDVSRGLLIVIALCMVVLFCCAVTFAICGGFHIGETLYYAATVVAIAAGFVGVAALMGLGFGCWFEWFE